MAKSAELYRMNISLPSELKQEMDAVTESVNWSAIAADAFRRKLLALTSQREGKNMTEAITRLKAAMEFESITEHELGGEDGKNWAMWTAKPKQLRLLSNHYERNGLQKFIEAARNRSDEHYPALVLANVLYGMCHPDTLFDDEAEVYIENDLRTSVDDLNNIPYLTGFVEAALEVWHLVNDE